MWQHCSITLQKSLSELCYSSKALTKCNFCRTFTIARCQVIVCQSQSLILPSGRNMLTEWDVRKELTALLYIKEQFSCVACASFACWVLSLRWNIINIVQSCLSNYQRTLENCKCIQSAFLWMYMHKHARWQTKKHVLLLYQCDWCSKNTLLFKLFILKDSITG